MPTVTIRPEGAASAVAGGAISPIIGGTGAVDDDSDTTYVESIRQVTGHAGSDDLFDQTRDYYWPFTPASDLGAFPGAPGGVVDLTWRARVEAVTSTVDYTTNAGVVPYGIGLVRLSDGLLLTSLVDESTGIGALPPSGPQWLTGTTPFEEVEWEALRTAAVSGFGAAGISAGWLGSPVTTGNDVGDETRIRLYELEFTYTIAVTERATRLFPRDDALGLGSAPRIFPPPRGGRLVGGYM